MADINPSFSLYNLTLKRPTGGLASIIGNFSGSRKTQEIVRATQTSLEVWIFNKYTKVLSRTHCQDLFCNIRNISALKAAESAKDLVVLTSDSGMLTIIEYDAVTNKFVPVANEPFYKTGIRRLSPGEYIAIDHRGRAAMVAALERNKLVYTFAKNNGSENQLTVRSPVEASRNGLLTYDMVSMDVGFENPTFAAIETDYNDPSHKKVLNYYEFDLGLNHVTLNETAVIDYTSNHIVAVPGGIDGPSGILLCSESMVQYRFPFKPSHYVPIPVRKNGQNSEKSIIVSSIVHKMKNDFFILLQNQFGDIFKVTLDFTTTQETQYDDLMNYDRGPGMVTSLKIRYFDTIPVCTSMVILKSGFLFADCEHSDKLIYQFEKLGDGKDETEWNSQDYPDEQSVLEESFENIEFETKANDNIVLVDTNVNLNPMLDLKVISGDFVQSLPELYSVTGMGTRSGVKVIHNDIPLSEIVTQDLPSPILHSFTCKIHKNDSFDKFIVLSFFDGSIILSIGEEVEEAENSGFIDTVTTLNVCQIGADSIVQVHATGLKQIFYSENDEPIKTVDWNPPPGIEVLKSACTNTQVVIALSNGDLVYFETSDSTDILVEYSLHKEFNASITDVCLGDIPLGRVRAPFIIVTCKDLSVHVLTTDPKNTLNTMFTTKLLENACSVAITSYRAKTTIDYKNEDDVDITNELLIRGHDKTINWVHIGLRNGVYLRYVLTDDGKLENLKMKLIIASPLKIFPISITNKNGESITLAVINSLLSFIVVPDLHDDIKLVPLPIPEKFVELDDETAGEEGEEGDEEEKPELVLEKTYGCIVPLHSEDVPQGLLVTHGDKLTIASVSLFNIVDQIKDSGDCQASLLDALSNLSNIETVPTRYTPRAICHSLSNTYKMSYIACSDLNIDSIFNAEEDGLKDNKEVITYGNMSDEILEKFQALQHVGYPSNKDKSGSCIHVFSEENLAIGQTIELLDSEMAYRLESATLEYNKQVGDYLLVSTIKKFNPSDSKKFEECFIRIYCVEEDGSLRYLYKQEFPAPVLAIHSFQGYVVLGFGNEIGLYQLGRLQMLRRTGIKLKDIGVHEIIDMKSSGFRLFISDIRSSVRILLYDSEENIFIPMVDDCVNRHITRSLTLDHDTIIVGDKFGTLSVLRCPNSDLEIEKYKFMNGSNVNMIKFELIMSFYVGDMITGLFLDQIGIGGEKSIIYGGINGLIGSLSAMKTVKEVNFFRELEKLMRKVYQGMKIEEGEEHDSKIEPNKYGIVDSDVLKFRSYYVPKKSCIDGDLIESFFSIDETLKERIASAMDRSVPQIEKRIIEMRHRVGY